MHMDHQSLIAAMLHDVIEDTGIEKSAIGEQFGPTVAELVDGVSKLNTDGIPVPRGETGRKLPENGTCHGPGYSRDSGKAGRQITQYADLGVLKSTKARRIARETLEIYAPIAARLGMNAVRLEFEELGFSALYPMRARRIDVASATIGWAIAKNW